MPRGKKKGTPARSEADKTPPPGEPAKKKAAQKIIDDDRKGGTAKRTNEHQEKPAKKSSDKETAEVEVKCPCCQEKITVRVFKQITKKAVSAEYKLYGVAEKDPQRQMDLGLDPKDGAGLKATATAEKKDAPGGGRKKAS